MALWVLNAVENRTPWLIQSKGMPEGRTVSDADAEAIAQRVVALLAGRLTPAESRPIVPDAARANNLIKSRAVMAFFGYKHRAPFWAFVKSKGVPCVALNSRVIMFDPVALNRWIAARSSDPNPRQISF